MVDKAVGQGQRAQAWRCGRPRTPIHPAALVGGVQHQAAESALRPLLHRDQQLMMLQQLLQQVFIQRFGKAGIGHRYPDAMLIFKNLRRAEAIGQAATVAQQGGFGGR